MLPGSARLSRPLPALLGSSNAARVRFYLRHCLRVLLFRAALACLAVGLAAQSDPQSARQEPGQSPAASEPAPPPRPFRSLVGDDSPLLERRPARGVTPVVIRRAEDASPTGFNQACTPPVGYIGGPVISNVDVVPVFWNSSVNSQIVSDIPGYFDRVESNPAAFLQVVEYSTEFKGGTDQFIGQGTAASSGITLNPKLCPATTTTACTLDDSDLQAELAADIKSGVLPQPATDSAGRVNTLYVVYFPPNVTLTLTIDGTTQTSCAPTTGFCGYHSWAGTQTNPTIYGAIMDFYSGACSTDCGGGTSLQNTESVSYHELNESITDPEVTSPANNPNLFQFPSAWGDNTSGCEIADFCDAFEASLTTKGVTDTTQMLWSNWMNNCVSPGQFPAYSVNMAATAAAGLPDLLTLTVQDPTQSPPATLTTYSGTVHFTSSDLKAKLPTDTTFLSGFSATKQLSVTFNTAGIQTVTATDTLNSLITVTTGPIAVNPPGSPGFTSPVPGSTLSGVTTFTWSPENKTVRNWRITMSRIGLGGTDASDTGVIAGSVTSREFFFPQEGVPLFIRLWFEVGITWSFVDAEYFESGKPSAPVINLPAPLSTLTGANVSFGWIGGNGNAQFEFTLGTSIAGSNEVFDSGVIHSTDVVNVGGIPTKGDKLFARLSYEVAGKWSHVDTTYTEAKGLPPASATTTTAEGASAVFNPAPQNLGVLATVTIAAGTVTNGWVTFTLFNNKTQIATPVTGDVSGNGTVDVDYPVPGGLPVGTYQIQAVYTPGAGFLASSDSSHTITVSPDTIQVNTATDPAVADPTSCPQNDSGACSLRDALAAAAEAGQATVGFDVTAFSNSNTTAENTLHLSTGHTLVIPANTTLGGPVGFNPLRNLVTIDGGGGSFGHFPTFTVNSGATGVVINNLTIANGSNPSGNGGAIANSGSLTVDRVTFTNSTASSGGAIANGVGGSSATLLVENSTFAGNTAGSGGGAVMNFAAGTLTVQDSTIAGNAATLAGTSGEGLGGGIFNENLLALTNTTIARNGAAGNRGAGLYNENPAKTAIANSLIDKNFDGTLASPGAADDIGDNAGGTAFGSGQGNKGGNVVGAYNAAIIDPVSPALASLANYGGLTETLLPLPGSSAICAGLKSNLIQAFDQRGNPDTNSSYSGVASQPCVDAGAVQTAYAMSFTTEPASMQKSGVAFPAAVGLTESGSPLTAATVGIPISVLPASAGVTLAGTPASTSTSTGIATYSLTANSAASQSSLQLQAKTTLIGGVSVSATSSNFSLSGSAPAPTVTAINPAAGANSGGTSVTITGTNFTGVAAVSFGAISAESFVVNSSTKITANSPAGTGTVDVTVTAAGGTSAKNSADHFTYVVPQATQVSVSVTPSTTFKYAQQPTVSFSLIPLPASGVPVADFKAALDNTNALTVTAGTTAGTFNITLPAVPLTVGLHTLQVSFSGISPFFLPSSGLAVLSVTPPSFTVTTATDDNSGPANCESGGSLCSLREALVAAADAGGGQILFNTKTFSAPTTITLENGALVLPRFTTVAGPVGLIGGIAAPLVTISGNNQSTVLISNAGSTGSALLNLGLDNGNQAKSAAGVPGFVVVNGGSGYANPTIAIKDPAGTGAAASAVVSNGTVSAIIVTNPGSGYTNPTITIEDSKGTGAQAIEVKGGGLVNYGTVLVLSSTFAGNTAPGGGGGILNLGSLQLIQDSISGNSAPTGAGILNELNGTLTVSQSTVSGNTASSQGGGIFTNGTITLDRSTIANNSVSAVSGQGGGIYITTPLTMFATTITGNHTGSSGTGGGVFSSSQVTASNSILAANSAGTFADLSASKFDDRGGNLAGTTSNGTSAINPRLTALGHHGGLTETMVPIVDSPAICHGLPANIPSADSVDERGEPIVNITYQGYSQASPCADSGAAQSHYLLQWITEPPNVTVGSAMTPAPQVQVQEGGILFADGSDSFPISLTLATGSGKITGGTASASASTGIATFSGLSIDTPGTGDIFTANLTVDSASAPVASLAQNSEFFNVAAPGQSTAFIAFGSAAQTIEGFGGSTAWMPQLSSRAAATLFSNANNNELGLSILRVRIDPGGSANWGTELGNAQAAQSRGAIVIATPWTPPASMKSNNSTVGGALNASEYAAYASYLNSFVGFLKNGGVNLYAISLQNEPDANVTYESCGWTGSTIDSWVRQEGSSIATKLFLPESESFNTSYSDPTLNDSAAVGNFSFIAGHLYGTFPKNYTNAFNHSKQVWVTEHYLTASGISGAMQMAQEMINAFSVGNYSAYLWWWVADWPAENYSNGLIDANNNVTLFGYIMAQWSKFVKTGYQRFNSTYEPTTNVFTNSFGGDGHSVIVAVNTGAIPISQSFSVSGTTISSFSAYQTSNAVQSLRNVGTVSVSNDTFTYTLPAQSVTTFYH